MPKFISYYFFITILCYTNLCLSFNPEEIDHTLSVPQNIQTISPNDIQDIYQLMKDVHELFEANDITYWAEGGTLLGCIRHQAIISWDDDLDIAIDHKDVFKLHNMESQLEALGYELILSHWLIIQSKTGPVVDDSCTYANKNIRFPWVDIFPFEIKSLKYVHASSHSLNRWPLDEFFVEAIQSRYLSSFGSLKIWIPAQAEEYLVKLYGEDVLTHGFWQGSHVCEHDSEVKKDYKWLLQDENKSPLLEKDDLKNRVKKLSNDL